ncbi:hypothetical protein M0R01_00505 [bacterium]|nr:hypothetical protein [bacterium]
MKTESLEQKISELEEERNKRIKRIDEKLRMARKRSDNFSIRWLMAERDEIFPCFEQKKRTLIESFRNGTLV